MALAKGTYSGGLGVVTGGFALIFPDTRWLGVVFVVLGIGIFVWGYYNHEPVKKHLIPVGLALGDAIRYMREALPNAEEYDLGTKLLDAVRMGNLPARGRKYHKLEGGMRKHICPLENVSAEGLADAKYNAWWAINQPNGINDNVIETTGLQGWWDVVVDGHALQQIWPPAKP